MPLTAKQQKTLDDLRRGNYTSIKLNELSSLLNGAFNKDESDEIKKDIIKGGVEWHLKTKSKVKDIFAINKILVSKIKKLATGDKSTKEMRAEERKLFKEVEDKIKTAGDMEKEEEEKHDDDTAKAPAPALPAPALPTPAPAQEGMGAVDYRVAELMAEERAEQRRQEIDTQDNSFLDVIDKYIDTGSQYYKDNKKTINKVLGAFKKKNIEDGSYLTKLAAIEFPEIEVFQKVIKDVGLGFSKEEKKKFERMLSRDKDIAGSVDSKEAMELMFKMFINPDQLGVLIKTRGQQMGDDIKDWYKKITGQPRVTDDQIDIFDKITKRREEIERQNKKKSDIDEWFGVPDEEEDKNKVIEEGDVNPFKPIHDGTADGKIAPGGSAYNPNMPVTDLDNLPRPDYNEMEAWQIIFPPDYGMGETTGWQDLMNTMKMIFSMGGIKVPTKAQNKAQYLEQLERENPAAFKQYQDAMAEYTKTMGKAGLERDSLVDKDVSKDYIENTKNLTKDLLQKAIASGQMDREVAENIYDSWDIFNKLETGDAQLSYAEMEQLQQKLINTIPKDILRENSDLVNQYITDNSQYLTPQWQGDSDLGNLDWLQNALDEGQGGETDGFDPETGKPKEKKITPKPPRAGAEPRYRYRGRWGGDEETFKRTAEEIEKRNLVIEVQRLREDLDTTNKLIQSQLMTEEKRFSNTFAMPPPQPATIKPLPNAFKKEHRAIFQPAVIPNPMRPFERNTRDAEYFGQYQNWEPTIMPTTARQDLLTNSLVYPSNADMATHGEQHEVAPPSQFNYIQNLRFTGY